MTRLTIDELEMLNPDELGLLFIDEYSKRRHNIDSDYLMDMIRVGCPVDILKPYGIWAFKLAVTSKNSPMLEFLVAEGVDINIIDQDGWTALHWATWFGDPDMVKLLVSKGADINKKDVDGYSALDLAGRYEYFDIVEFMTEN